MFTDEHNLTFLIAQKSFQLSPSWIRSARYMGYEYNH